MIYFNFTIQNPWHTDKRQPWKDIFQGQWKITRNKNFEFRLDYYTYDWFEFGLNTRWRGEDHAGVAVDIRLFGLGVSVGVSDQRHWNYDKNRWVDYSNREEVKEYW